MLTALIIILIIILAIFLLVDFLKKGPNDFIDKWLKRILWLWLPFYSLYYLTKELISKFGGENEQVKKQDKMDSP